MSGFNFNMLPKQFPQRPRPSADMAAYPLQQPHHQLGAAAAAATLGSEWAALAATSGGAGGGQQRPHPAENAVITNNLQQPLHQHQHLHHPSPQAQRIFTQLQQPQQPQQQQQQQQPQAPSAAPMYNGNQHPPFHALRQPGAAQPGAHPGFNPLQQQNMLQQQQINQQQQQAQQQQQHLLNVARNSNNQSLFLPPGAPNPEMARALQNISRGHIGAPQPNPLFAAANRPTNQTPQTAHLQPQPSTSADLLNQLQSRIRTAAQNRDYQELQKAQSEIDRVLESQKPQYFELKRALESGHFAHSPQLETLKMHHDQKQKFIAILDSFRNAAGAEISRIIQFTNNASGVAPGPSMHGPLRPPSVNGPSNNVPGPLHLGQPRAPYSIQPTPGGPVTPAPARPPSSSPMPQPGVAHSQEAQEASFRNLLRMGNLPSSLWNIQGKQIDPWLLHRTVSTFGGLQQMNPQRWAMLGLQFGYPATRQIGTQPGASAEVADQLHTAYREMVSKLNAVSLSSGSLFSRGFAHPLANMPPERLQQILAQQRQRESGQESLIGSAPGLGGPPSASQPGMPAQPSQQQQQSRLSVPGLPGQPQQSGIPGGAGIGVGSAPGQYLAPPPQGNPQVPRPPQLGMQQQQPVNVSPGPLTQQDMNRPPNSEAPEAAVVLRMQEKANEIFRSQMAHSANANMPSQPTPNMNEWLPRWNQLESRTKFFVSRLGLFMYWFRGVQSNRAFQMAIPTAVRIYKQTEALRKNPPVFYIGVEDLNGFLGFMGQCVHQLETRMRQVRHWDPLLAGMRDLPPLPDPIAPPPTYSLAPPQPPPEAHRPSPVQMPSVPTHSVQTPGPVSQPTPGPSMPAQPLRPRRGAIDHNALHNAVAGSSPAHPVPTPPAHAQTPPGATPKTRVASAKGARPNTRSSFSKAKAGPNKAPTPAAPAPSTPAAPAEPVAVPALTAPAPNPSLKRKHEQIEAANLGPKVEEPVNKRAKTAEPPVAPQPTATTATTLVSVPPIQEPAPIAPAAPVAAQQQQMPMVVTPQQLQLSTPINPSTYTTPEAVLELVRSRGDALQNEIPSAQYEAADAGSVAETLRFIERLMSSHIKPPSSDGPSASTAPGSTAAPKDANNTSTIPDDAYDPFEFFDYTSYAEDLSMPELEKSNLHSTVSPESNAAQDAMMKTPPSQSPKKSVTVAAPANDSARVPSGVENSFGDRLTLGEPSYYQNPDFKFEGSMPGPDPWVIAPA